MIRLRPLALSTLVATLVLLVLPAAACGGRDELAGTWRCVDEHGREAHLEIVETDDYWKASQLDRDLLGWDANVFRLEGGRLVSFGDGRPQFATTIDLDGDTLTVHAATGTFVYARQ